MVVLPSIQHGTCNPTLCGLNSASHPSKAFTVTFERFTVKRLSYFPGNVKLWESPGRAGGLPTIIKEIPKENYMNLRDLKVLAEELRKSVKVLHDKRHYTAALCVIACGIDAFVNRGKKRRDPQREIDYCAAIKKHFFDSRMLPSEKFYTMYRHGIAHEFAPNCGFVMYEDHELNGKYVGKRKIKGFSEAKIGLNMDRLIEDFIKLCDHVISGKPVR